MVDAVNRPVISVLERRKRELLKSQRERLKEQKKNKNALKKSGSSWRKIANSLSTSLHGNKTCIEIHGSSRSLLSTPSDASSLTCSVIKSQEIIRPPSSKKVHGVLKSGLNNSLHGASKALSNSLHGKQFKELKSQMSELQDVVESYTKENQELLVDAQELLDENDYLAKELEVVSTKQQMLTDANDNLRRDLQKTQSQLFDTQDLLRELLMLTTSVSGEHDSQIEQLRVRAQEVLTLDPENSKPPMSPIITASVWE